MKLSVRRRLSLGLGLTLVGAMAAMPVTPAAALDATVSCRTLLSTTPGIEVDVNNDGNPEFRAPRIYDVTLCSDASYGYVTYPPTIENCSEQPKGGIDCNAVRITAMPVYAGAHAEGEVCASIEGFGRSCLPFDSGQWDWTAPNVICVGYDLGGGHPCDGSLLAFE